MQQELKIRNQQHNKCMDSNPPFPVPKINTIVVWVMTALIMIYTMTKTHNYNLTSYHHENLESQSQWYIFQWCFSRQQHEWKPWTCQISVTTVFNIMYLSVRLLTFRSSEPLTRWLVITVLSLYKQGSNLRLLYVKAGWCLGLIPAAWAHRPVRYTSSKWNKGVLRAAW